MSKKTFKSGLKEVLEILCNIAFAILFLSGIVALVVLVVALGNKRHI